MNYKVGDRGRIKTWDEMKKELSVISNTIHIPNCFFGIHWDKSKEDYPPKNRIVTIAHFNKNIHDPCFYTSNGAFFFIEMIKCHANEYYLQEIKDEIQGKR